MNYAPFTSVGRASPIDHDEPLLALVRDEEHVSLALSQGGFPRAERGQRRNGVDLAAPAVRMSPLSLWGRPVPPPATGALAGRPPQVRTVIRDISEKHGIPIYDVMSQSRKRAVVRCRWEIWSILIEAGRSYPKVGSFFGKDHTTILYGTRKHRELHPKLEAAE